MPGFSEPTLRELIRQYEERAANAETVERHEHFIKMRDLVLQLVAEQELYIHKAARGPI